MSVEHAMNRNQEEASRHQRMPQRGWKVLAADCGKTVYQKALKIYSHQGSTRSSVPRREA